jgi:hypothetical protein
VVCGYEKHLLCDFAGIYRKRGAFPEAGELFGKEEHFEEHLHLGKVFCVIIWGFMSMQFWEVLNGIFLMLKWT